MVGIDKGEVRLERPLWLEGEWISKDFIKTAFPVCVRPAFAIFFESELLSRIRLPSRNRGRATQPWHFSNISLISCFMLVNLDLLPFHLWLSWWWLWPWLVLLREVRGALHRWINIHFRESHELTFSDSLSYNIQFQQIKSRVLLSSSQNIFFKNTSHKYEPKRTLINTQNCSYEQSSLLLTTNHHSLNLS